MAHRRAASHSTSIYPAEAEVASLYPDPLFSGRDEAVYDEHGREICFHEECLKDIENPDSVGEPQTKSGRELWKEMYRSLRDYIGLGAARADHFFKAMWALVHTFDRYRGWFYSAPSALLADKMFPYWVAASFVLMQVKPVADLINSGEEPSWVGMMVKEYMKSARKSANALGPVKSILSGIISGMFIMKTGKTPLPALWWAMSEASAPGRTEYLGTALASVFIKYEKERFCTTLKEVLKMLKKKDVSQRACAHFAESFFNLRSWRWQRISNLDVLDEATGGRPELLLWMYDEGIYSVPEEVATVVSDVRKVLLRDESFKKQEAKVRIAVGRHLV